MLFAWAYEMTPEGLKPTSAVDPAQSIAHETGTKLNYAAVSLLSIAITLLLVQNYLPSSGRVAIAGNQPAGIEESADAPPPVAGNPVTAVPDASACGQAHAQVIEALEFARIGTAGAPAALERVEAAAAACPGSAGASIALALLRIMAAAGEDEIEQAVALARATSPESLASAIAQAEALADAGRWYELDRTVRAVIETNDHASLSEAHGLLAETLLATGHRLDALEHLELARALDPSSPRVSAGLARTYMSLNRFDEARAELERGMGNLPGRPPLAAQNLAGQFYFLPLAAQNPELMREFVVDNPNWAQRFRDAAAYFVRDDRETALAEFRGYLESEPANSCGGSMRSRTTCATQASSTTGAQPAATATSAVRWTKTTSSAVMRS